VGHIQTSGLAYQSALHLNSMNAKSEIADILISRTKKRWDEDEGIPPLTGRTCTRSGTGIIVGCDHYQAREGTL
jgi:hypothetical protein